MAVLPCQIERPNEHIGKTCSEQLGRELLVWRLKYYTGWHKEGYRKGEHSVENTRGGALARRGSTAASELTGAQPSSPAWPRQSRWSPSHQKKGGPHPHTCGWRSLPHRLQESQDSTWTLTSTLREAATQRLRRLGFAGTEPGLASVKGSKELWESSRKPPSKRDFKII